MNTKQKWESMTPEERRSNVDAYLINTSLNLINPTSKDGFWLNRKFNYYGMDYIVFKVTRDESRNTTFYFTKQI